MEDALTGRYDPGADCPAAAEWLRVESRDAWLRAGVMAVAADAGRSSHWTSLPLSVWVLPDDLYGQLTMLRELAGWWGSARHPVCIVLTDLPVRFVTGTLRGLLPSGHEGTGTLRCLPLRATPAHLRDVLQGRPAMPLPPRSRTGQVVRPLPPTAFEALQRYLEQRNPLRHRGQNQPCPGSPLFVAMHCLGVHSLTRLLSWRWQRHAVRRRYRDRQRNG